MALIDAGVTVALGVTDAWQVPHTRFDAAWVSTYMCITTLLWPGVDIANINWPYRPR